MTESGFLDRWLLPALLFWPLLGAALVRLIGRSRPVVETADSVPSDVLSGAGIDARTLTLGVLVVEAALGLTAWVRFDAAVSGWQLRADLPWLPDLGARISLGVDGLALPMLVLTTLLMPLALLATWNQVTSRMPSYGALLLVLTSGLVGVFTALDLLLFYLAWELMLIPMYFIIGIWGSAGRSRAALKYVMLTMFGSLLMLAAVVALYVAGGSRSFHLDDLLQLSLTLPAQLYMFSAFFLAFAIKSALVPFHTWLPDAQFEAPLLAAVVLGLKVGTYAILRFAMPLFPAAVVHETVQAVVLVLSVLAIVWGALVAVVQPDLRKVLSYSSISHLGFIMLGCFALTQQSVDGAVMIMVNHGITTSALFLLAGFLREQQGTDSLRAFGGLARVVPLFSAMLMLSMFSTMGLPGTNGFVGEFLVLLGSYRTHPVLATIATSGVVIAAVYGLRALQQLLFSGLDAERNGRVRDLHGRQLAVMAVFAVAMLWIGLAPQSLLRRVAPASTALIARVRAPDRAPDRSAVAPVPATDPATARRAVTASNAASNAASNRAPAVPGGTP